MPRLFFLTYRKDSGLADSGSLRDFRLKAIIQQLGFQVVHAAPRSAINAEPGDVIWLSRPKSFALHKKTRAPKVQGVRTVYDSVDIHWVRHLRGLMTGATSSLPKKILGEIRWELEAMVSADIVLCVCDNDAEAVRLLNPSIKTFVVSNIAPSVPPPRVVLRNRTGISFVGNFRHKPNQDGLEWFLEEVLPLIDAQTSFIPVTVIGGNAPKRLFQRFCSRVHFAGLLESSSDEVSRHRVSIAPIRYGSGQKGKVLEALVTGTPVVTTEAGAEGMNLKDFHSASISSLNAADSLNAS